jgi:hypothetical protein
LIKSCDIFEERMIDYCEACSRQAWINQPIVPLPNSYKGMTLLHLAAALGYSRLIKTFIQWRTEKSCMVLEYEVDALSLDDCSCTPFVSIKEIRNKISTENKTGHFMIRICKSEK